MQINSGYYAEVDIKYDYDVPTKDYNRKAQ